MAGTAQPSLVNTYKQTMQALGPFVGIDATTSAYYLDPSLATDSLNVVPNRRYKGYATTQGRAAALASNLPSAVFGMTKFQRYGVSPTVYLAACNSGGVGVLEQFTLGGTPSALTLPSGTSLLASKATYFTQYQQWAFVSNGNDQPLKIDTSLNVSRWQIAAPTTAPSASAGGAGNLQSTGLAPYQWRVTFGNSLQESSPSPVGPAAGLALNAQSASLTGIPVSTDPQCTQRNIYRIGGTLGVWLLIATINDNTTTTYTDNTADLSITGQQLTLHQDPPQAFFAINTHKDRVWGFGYNAQTGGLAVPSAPVLSLVNSGTLPARTEYWKITYTGANGIESLPSAEASIAVGINQVVSCASPSASTGATGWNAYAALSPNTETLQNTTPTAIATPFQEPNSGLVLGVGTPANQPSDLWYSNYAQPWGFDNTNNVLPIGRNPGNDVAVQLASIGDLQLCFKTKSTWAVFGDSQSDFLQRKLFDIGCVSARSVATAYGIVYWLSDQGVYVFDGSTPKNLSDSSNGVGSIKKVLDSFSTADLAAAVGFIRDQCYCISFPTQGVTYGYYAVTQAWFKLGWATDCAVFDIDNAVTLDEVTASEVGTGVVDSWFAAETDLGLSITSTWMSGVSDAGDPQSSKQYTGVSVLAPVQAGATIAVLTTIDPGNVQKTNSRVFDLSLGPQRHFASMPPNMVGFESQMMVTVTSSALTEIHRVMLFGYRKRVFNSKG